MAALDDKVERREAFELAKRIHDKWHRIAQTIEPEPLFKDFEISAFRKPYEEGREHAQNFLNAWMMKHHLKATRRRLVKALIAEDMRVYAVEVFGQDMISALLHSFFVGQWDEEQASND
eukprot:m.11538 g.11538  ORF g.11538 m.11538 type:complete len:119 (+) comp23487_c0_seq1:70-426(+)